MTGVVALRAAGTTCGTKARTLGRLLRAGLAVPDGVVVVEAAGPGWQHVLPRHLDALGADTFAVRSSSVAEDGAGASYAGQLRTVLHVPPAEVEDAVRSVAGATAVSYEAALGLATGGGVAVLVQPMLAPVAAGVAFTRDPVTGAVTTVVEAVTGLGEPLVSGGADPERWRVEPGGGARVDRARGVLTVGTAAAVAAHAEHVERLLGGPQDVEWAVDAAGTVWTLQARPVTARPGTRPLVGSDPAGAPEGALLGAGVPAGPGTARGRVRVLRSIDDLAWFLPGEVLVCRATSPAWTPALARAAAVVTEVGGLLSHAAIVARELGVPAVTGVPGAHDLPGGALVSVDGSAGTVRLVGTARPEAAS